MTEKRMCLCGAVDLAQHDTPGVVITGWGSHGLQACTSGGEGRQETELEYAPKGTTDRLALAEAVIHAVRYALEDLDAGDIGEPLFVDIVRRAVSEEK